MKTTPDNELFDNYFGEWLKANGVTIGEFHDTYFDATIDLNTLKQALQQLIDRAEIHGSLKGKDEVIAHYKKYGNLNYYLAVAQKEKSDAPTS